MGCLVSTATPFFCAHTEPQCSAPRLVRRSRRCCAAPLGTAAPHLCCAAGPAGAGSQSLLPAGLLALPPALNRSADKSPAKVRALVLCSLPGKKIERTAACKLLVPSLRCTASVTKALACVRSSFPASKARRENSPGSAGRSRSMPSAPSTARTTAGEPCKCSSAQFSPAGRWLERQEEHGLPGLNGG